MSSSLKCSEGSLKIVEQDCKVSRALGGLIWGDVAEQLDSTVFADGIVHQLPVEHYVSIKCTLITTVRWL